MPSDSYAGEALEVRRYTVRGRPCLAHPGCIDGFRCDRSHGAIYPAVRDPDTGQMMTAEAYSLEAGRCVYCDLYQTRT